MLDVESSHCVLDEGDVFFWPEEDLDGLPAYESFLCEGGDGGGRKVVDGRLKCVLASY